MAKWSGTIGFAENKETVPGVWSDSDVVEKFYRGDLLMNWSKSQPSGDVNDNIIVTTQISIVADPYARQNFYHMKYIEYMGERWKVSTIDATRYPRLIISLGGIYNG